MKIDGRRSSARHITGRHPCPRIWPNALFPIVAQGLRETVMGAMTFFCGSAERPTGEGPPALFAEFATVLREIPPCANDSDLARTANGTTTDKENRQAVAKTRAK